MSWMSRLKKLPRRYWCADGGSVTVEFVIVFPFVLGLLFMAIDSGVTQLRQVFLHRAVDLAVREVRLGRVNASDRLSELICERTAMLPNCGQSITVEMQPVDTTNFAGLNDPNQCIDREQEITPAVNFNPGMGGQEQELMLIKVCVVADPFVRITGFVSLLPINGDGDYVLVANSIFVNEPR